MDVHGKDGLQVIKENTEVPILLPWNGEFGLFTIRMLNATQLRACGDFTTLELDTEEDETKAPDFEAIKSLKNMQEKMFTLALVKPTFNEMCDILEVSATMQRFRETLKHAREQIRLVEDVEEMHEYEEQIEFYENALGFLLPDDFSAALTALLLQKDNTDIRKVTKEMLFEAAIMAEKGHDNPSDHISGVFTDFQHEDINKYAWIELAKYKEMQDTDKSANGRVWVRGKKRRK
jgi:hypothetical protein